MNELMFIGGPAYYIQRGLHQRWMAVTFAVLITCQFGLSNNSIQANTICSAMQEAFGQKRRGIKDPVFHRSQIPELEDELECW